MEATSDFMKAPSMDGYKKVDLSFLQEKEGRDDTDEGKDKEEENEQPIDPKVMGFILPSEELNKNIRLLCDNITKALSEQDYTRAAQLAKVLGVMPKSVVDRAVNPVNPKIREALLARIKKISTEFNVYRGKSEVNSFCDELLRLVRVGKLEVESVKEIVLPVIVDLIKEGYPEVDRLQDFF